KVGGERHAHSTEQRDREADVKARLVLFVVAAHVADGIHGGDDPQAAGEQGEQDAQRFAVQGKREAWQHRDQRGLDDLSFEHCEQDAQGHRKQRGRRHQRDGFPQIRPASCQHDQHGADKRHQQGELECGRCGHEVAPIKSVAAYSAIPVVSRVSMPSQMLAMTSAHIGTSIDSGASHFSSVSACWKYATSTTRQMYTTAISEPTTTTRTTGHQPSSIAARMRYHLLTRPTVRGTPIRLRPPATKAAMVSGMRRPSPRMSLR